MKEEDLLNYDIDIHNLLDSFPEDDSNGVIYLRGNAEFNNSPACGSLLYYGRSDIVGSTIFACMNEDDKFASIVLNSVANYLEEHKDKVCEMKKVLNNF